MEGRRDKFASLQAASASPQQPNQTSSPRRDKFASLAAKQQQENKGTAQGDSQKPNHSNPAARRDKFASLAQSGRTPKRDKFAALNNKTNEDKALPSASATAARSTDARATQLQARIRQRKSVLADLEQAEGLTWTLTQVASTTAKALADLKDESTDGLLSLTKKYRETLQKIHSLLSPHSALVVAYQNHNQDEESSNMYAARVEMRLAQERRKVVSDFLEIERGLRKKRKFDTL